MSVVLNSSLSQYLNAGVLVSAKPISISAWVKTTSDSANQAIVCLSNNSNEFLLSQLRGGIANDPLGVLEYAIAWKYGETSTGYSTDIWTHTGVVFNSSTDRRAYLDGGGKVTNTDSQDVNFGILSYFFVGTHKSVGGAYFDGKIAQVAIWEVALSDAQWVDLAAGVNPQLIAASDLAGYWTLEFDGSSEVDSNDFGAYNGATYDADDNPEIGGTVRYPTSNLSVINRVVVTGNDSLYYSNL